MSFMNKVACILIKRKHINVHLSREKFVADFTICNVKYFFVVSNITLVLYRHNFRVHQSSIKLEEQSVVDLNNLWIFLEILQEAWCGNIRPALVWVVDISIVYHLEGDWYDRRTGYTIVYSEIRILRCKCLGVVSGSCLDFALIVWVEPRSQNCTLFSLLTNICYCVLQILISLRNYDPGRLAQA